MWMSLAPALHRVDQHPVDQLDHRRVFDLRLGGDFLLRLLHHLDVFARGLHVLEEALQLLLIVGVMLLDQVPQGELAREHREEIEPGDELEIFQQAVVGRIGHGDGEGTALPLERKNHRLGRQVGRHQLDDLGIDFEAGKIHRRHAILPGQELGDLQLGHQPQLDQDVAKPMLARLLLDEGLRQLLPRDQPLAEQDLTEPVGATCGCGRHDRVCSGQKLLTGYYIGIEPGILEPPGSWHRHVLPDHCHRRGTHPGNPPQVVDRLKWAVLRTVLHD